MPFFFFLMFFLQKAVAVLQPARTVSADPDASRIMKRLVALRGESEELRLLHVLVVCGDHRQLAFHLKQMVALRIYLQF
jgi:hypothetical protein